MELTELCHELNNWFDVERYFGEFNISGGTISLSALQENQYFRIIGSVFNDGVHKYPTTDLADESFEGAVWAMAVPPAVIALLDEINSWEETYGTAILSPFNSESFGGYSYSKSTGNSGNNDGGSADYRNVFGNKLNKWRKV